MFIKLNNLAPVDCNAQQAVISVDSITAITRCVGKLYIDTKTSDHWAEWYTDEAEAKARYEYLNECINAQEAGTIHELVNGVTKWKTLVDLRAVESLVLDADRFQVRYNTSKDTFVETCDSLPEAEHRFAIAENKWRKARAVRK